MNMKNLMAQAQKMQKDIQNISNELENKEYSEDNGIIKLIMNGKREIIKFEINKQENFEDIELLEDMIVTAFNKVLKNIEEEKERKLGKYTGGLGRLF